MYATTGVTQKQTKKARMREQGEEIQHNYRAILIEFAISGKRLQLRFTIHCGEK